MSELVKIKMHGIFAEKIGNEFNLAVKSVPEAFHAINILTNDSWRKMQLENIQDNLKYSILINEKPIDISSLAHITEENAHEQQNVNAIYNSELFLNQKEGLRSIDIVPVSEGGDATFWIYVIVVIITTLITLALMKPPKFDDFREIEDTRKGQSYLFSGPTNTVNEGGPVPLGYGRVIAGSQVISQSYQVYYENADSSDANISSTERVSEQESGGDTSLSNMEDATKPMGDIFGTSPVLVGPQYSQGGHLVLVGVGSV
jgi:predicted phage tail protein